jgi:hypothetical protein
MDKSAVPASASKFSQVLNALSQGDNGDDQSDPAESVPASSQMNRLAPIGQQFPAISPDPSDAPADSNN